MGTSPTDTIDFGLNILSPAMNMQRVLVYD